MLKQFYWPLHGLKKYIKLLIAGHLLVKGCGKIISELSEAFLGDNVWIIYCQNLNNLCMKQCRVIIAITMFSSVAVSCIWSWMLITLHSLSSAFHFIFNKGFWVKGDGSELDKSSQVKFLKSFFLKIFISFHYYFFFFIYSKSEIQSCLLLCHRDKPRDWKCPWLDRKDFSTSPLKEQLLSSIISWSNSPGV